MTPDEHKPDAHWDPAAESLHHDPLLECLVQLTRIHGVPASAEALAGGLPRVDHLLPPSQFTRAAARAGLKARLVRQAPEDVNSRLLPAVLLLKDRRAALLLGRTPAGDWRLSLPEAIETVVELSPAELATQLSGTIILVQPLFRFETRAPGVRKLRGEHWFWSAMAGNWRLYRDVMAAAFLVNVFALAMPLFSMNVYDRVVPNRAIETLWVLAIGALLVLAFDFALRTLRAFIIDVASKRVDIVVSARIMERVLGVRFASRPASVGTFAANLRAFEGVRDFIASATVTALIDLPFVFIFLLVLLWISPWMLIPTLIAMVLVVGVALFTQSKMHELTEQTYRASAQRNAGLIESLVGLETVKTLGAESEMQRRWERATLFLAQISARTRLLSTSTMNFAQSVQQANNIFTIILGVYLLNAGEVSMGAIIAASMIAGRALAPLGQVAGLMMQFQNARTGLKSVDEQMRLPVERPEGADFLHREDLRGEIEFRDVSFAYPGSGQPALRKASLRIMAGEKVGIIGRVGSGKTTLEKLILGLYQPDEGAVLIDGIDARQIDPAELRREIGFVPQDSMLFFGSLKQNITMGAPLASDAAILAAAEISGVAEFANAHPKGFDMPIGERGESLSGGQRQAVAIARAVLGDPAILLLDEPASNMDHQSEVQLRQRLRAYATDRTLVMVTHRSSMLELVDRLIVVDKGAIVADGPKQQVVEALQHGRIGRAS